MPIEYNYCGETVYEAKSRFRLAGKFSRYCQLMKRFKKAGMTPMEAFKATCIEKEMRPEKTDKIIAFKKKTGRIKTHKGS